MAETWRPRRRTLTAESRKRGTYGQKVGELKPKADACDVRVEKYEKLKLGWPYLHALVDHLMNRDSEHSGTPRDVKLLATLLSFRGESMSDDAHKLFGTPWHHSVVAWRRASTLAQQANPDPVMLACSTVMKLDGSVESLLEILRIINSHTKSRHAQDPPARASRRMSESGRLRSMRCASSRTRKSMRKVGRTISSRTSRSHRRFSRCGSGIRRSGIPG